MNPWNIKTILPVAIIALVIVMLVWRIAPLRKLIVGQ